MIELALVTLIIGAFIGAVVWLMNWSGKAAENKVIVDEQAKAIKEIQERNEIERNTPVAGAARRLQDGPFVRD